MKEYKLFYIDKSNRIECMLVCSLKKRINWCEDGLKLLSWKYNLIDKGSAETLNEIFKKHSVLNVDRRKKKQNRTINIGDVIYFDDEAWIVSAFGFKKIPEFLWNKVKI
jgi:hypothetical protein